MNEDLNATLREHADRMKNLENELTTLVPFVLAAPELTLAVRARAWFYWAIPCCLAAAGALAFFPPWVVAIAAAVVAACGWYRINKRTRAYLQLAHGILAREFPETYPTMKLLLDRIATLEGPPSRKPTP